MSKIAVVTSCSALGWREYGDRFVKSFLRHWPETVDLYVVSEDPASIVLSEPSRAFYGRSLWDSKGAADFALRHQNNPRAHGRVLVDSATNPTKHAHRIANGGDFRYDAFKFAKKVFAIEAIADQVKTGRLFWVDADVFTFAPVPMSLINKVLPRDRALSCLDRDAYHSECGFVGYNLDHKRCREFITDFARLYASDDVFHVPEWHDSYVFDWLRRKLKTPTHKIPHKSRKHPFVNSELGRYMDHYKGARKGAGRTPASELVCNRDVPYWREAAA